MPNNNLIERTTQKQITIWFIIWAFTVFTFRWFFNELYNLFTPFLMFVPIAILVIWSILFAVWGIGFLIKSSLRVRRFQVQSAVPVLILIAAVLVLRFVPAEMLKVKLEYQLYLSRRMEIVALVQQKALADDGGNVILPAGYRELSTDGELHIYQNDKNGTVVGFWVFRGLLMNPYTSVIYTSDDAPPTAQNLDCSRIYNATRLGANWYYVKAY